MQHLISDTARLQPAMPPPLNLLGHVDASYILSRTFTMLPCIPGCEWDRLRTTIPAAFSAFPHCFQFLQTLTDILACELVEISLSLSFSIALTCKKKQIFQTEQPETLLRLTSQAVCAPVRQESQQYGRWLLLLLCGARHMETDGACGSCWGLLGHVPKPLPHDNNHCLILFYFFKFCYSEG